MGPSREVSRIPLAAFRFIASARSHVSSASTEERRRKKRKMYSRRFIALLDISGLIISRDGRALVVCRGIVSRQINDTGINFLLKSLDSNSGSRSSASPLQLPL